DDRDQLAGRNRERDVVEKRDLAAVGAADPSRQPVDVDPDTAARRGNRRRLEHCDACIFANPHGSPPALACRDEKSTTVRAPVESPTDRANLSTGQPPGGRGPTANGRARRSSGRRSASRPSKASTASRSGTWPTRST